MAPHTSNPESRGDLESLTRLATEQFSAAFGIPADLIFSGRFAGKSTSQCATPCCQSLEGVSGGPNIACITLPRHTRLHLLSAVLCVLEPDYHF